jgi:hypothetical protein
MSATISRNSASHPLVGTQRDDPAALLAFVNWCASELQNQREHESVCLQYAKLIEGNMARLVAATAQAAPRLQAFASSRRTLSEYVTDALVAVSEAQAHRQYAGPVALDPWDADLCSRVRAIYTAGPPSDASARFAQQLDLQTLERLLPCIHAWLVAAADDADHCRRRDDSDGVGDAGSENVGASQSVARGAGWSAEEHFWIPAALLWSARCHTAHNFFAARPLRAQLRNIHTDLCNLADDAARGPLGEAANELCCFVQQAASL